MKDFDKIIWGEALVLIDFFATWCAPCQTMHPIIDKFCRQAYGRVDVYKIDIDSQEDASIIRRYDIRAVPTFIFFQHGKILWRSSGKLSFEQLCEVLDRVEAHKQPAEVNP